jgi:hypothetical protein
MGCDLHAIAAQLHAAPVGVILRSVIKIENARVAPAFFHKRQVAGAQKVARGLSQRSQPS